MRFYTILFADDNCFVLIIDLYVYALLFSNVNDDILVADIEEKEKAEEKFDESLKRGQTAATVEARWVINKTNS